MSPVPRCIPHVCRDATVWWNPQMILEVRSSLDSYSPLPLGHVYFNLRKLVPKQWQFATIRVPPNNNQKDLRVQGLLNYWKWDGSVNERHLNAAEMHHWPMIHDHLEHEWAALVFQGLSGITALFCFGAQGGLLFSVAANWRYVFFMWSTECKKTSKNHDKPTIRGGITHVYCWFGGCSTIGFPNLLVSCHVAIGSQVKRLRDVQQINPTITIVWHNFPQEMGGTPRMVGL